MTRPLNEEERWVQEVRSLSAQISARLGEIAPRIPEDSVGNISHHLAEISVQSHTVETLVKLFLEVNPRKREQLATVSHELLEELREIKEAIDDISEDLTKLVNVLMR